MDMTRNPGVLTVTVGVALAVLFALLGLTGVFDGQIGFGLAVISLIVAALLYIFFMRGTGVERSGYAALLFLLALGLIIPLFIVNQQQAQASQKEALYDQTLHRGASLFGQYCAPCHGYQGKGKIGPKLNGSDAVAKLQDEDIRRIISGGVPNSSDINGPMMMPAWSQAYGGPLSEDDIQYLVTLIRSSQPTYLDQHPTLSRVNGWDYVYDSLINDKQRQDYQADKSGSNKPAPSAFTDKSGQKDVTIDAIGQSAGAWAWQLNGAQNANVIISAGTTITFGNKSTGPHNVANGTSDAPGTTWQTSSILAPNSSDTFKFTFDKPGEYPFYCALHPQMIGWITVK